MDVSINLNDKDAVAERAAAIKTDSAGRTATVYRNPKDGMAISSALGEDEAVWLLRCEANNSKTQFAGDLASKLNRFGHGHVTAGRKMRGLSDSQLFWCYKLANKELDRLTQVAPTPVKAAAIRDVGNFNDLAENLIALKNGGQKKPKMRAVATASSRPDQVSDINTLVFSLAYSEQWGGTIIFVRDGRGFGSRKLVARIQVVDEKWVLTYRSNYITDGQQIILLAVAKDFAGELRAYGLMTGSCSICGRKLTDPVSVAEGIGPVCAKRLGVKWGTSPSKPPLGPPPAPSIGWTEKNRRAMAHGREQGKNTSPGGPWDFHYSAGGTSKADLQESTRTDTEEVAGVDSKTGMLVWTPLKDPKEEGSVADRVRQWVDDMAGDDTREQLLEKAGALGLID